MPCDALGDRPATPIQGVTVLELRDVSYGYHDDRLALSHVSVSLRAGERVAVLGENGAGKSTFFLCCIGVLKPESGEILLDGAPVGTSKRDLIRLRSSVGLVFQDPDDQIVSSTVESEIAFGPLNMGLSDGEVRERVREAAGALELEALMERPPHFLSGGEKKRVTIADVLAMRPRVVLLDEPTSSLDPRGTRTLRDTLGALSDAGMAVVVSTHDVDFAYAWADRVLVFNAGRLVADGDARTVFAQRDLLHACHLEIPLLASVADVLREACGHNTPTGDEPRTIEDLPDYMAKLCARSPLTSSAAGPL